MWKVFAIASIRQFQTHAQQLTKMYKFWWATGHIKLGILVTKGWPQKKKLPKFGVCTNMRASNERVS